MKIYIAGKITNTELNSCKLKFALTEHELKSMGLNPVNPFKLGCNENWTFQQCKPFNFKAIRQCEAIFMLNDYQDSPGSLEELKEAKRLKLEVYYQSADDINVIRQSVSYINTIF